MFPFFQNPEPQASDLFTVSPFTAAKDEVFSKKFFRSAKRLAYGSMVAIAFLSTFKGSEWLYDYAWRVSQHEKKALFTDVLNPPNPLIYMAVKDRDPGKLIVMTPGIEIDRNAETERLASLNTFAPEATVKAVPPELDGNAYGTMLELIEDSVKDRTLDLLVIGAHGNNQQIFPSKTSHNDCATMDQLFNDLQEIGKRHNRQVAKHIILDSCSVFQRLSSEDVDRFRNWAKVLGALIEVSRSLVMTDIVEKPLNPESGHQDILCENLCIAANFVSIYPDGTVGPSKLNANKEGGLNWIRAQEKKEERYLLHRKKRNLPEKSPKTISDESWFVCHSGESQEEGARRQQLVQRIAREENALKGEVYAAEQCATAPLASRRACLATQLTLADRERPKDEEILDAERILEDNRETFVEKQLSLEKRFPRGPEIMVKTY